MDYRNATFNAAGTIDCEVDHRVYGWIPFTASPDDTEEYGRDIFAAASADATPYVPPPPPSTEEVRASMPPLSPRQLRLALLSIGLHEADVDMKLVNDPAGMVEWKYATYFKRSHPLVEGLGALFFITADQIDSLWLWAAEL
ncbi:hypothetical protein CK228_13595 [Mesorhizobium sp. WSM4312]|uniref:hypothetical protein n=1 Tax=Mesorhizobium sp. WSM4312 TaxID=2029411 RepID=UPI000BB042AE|nr:hypothetical protein [Mesorhizobium sp. WSM4312]PBB68138.1 hypothetical protein CK228_13595 [Mesorhizobium sp. WSM4312]